MPEKIVRKHPTSRGGETWEQFVRCLMAKNTPLRKEDNPRELKASRFPMAFAMKDGLKENLMDGECKSHTPHRRPLCDPSQHDFFDNHDEMIYSEPEVRFKWKQRFLLDDDARNSMFVLRNRNFMSGVTNPGFFG
jgi:hypothetical protein